MVVIRRLYDSKQPRNMVLNYMKSRLDFDTKTTNLKWKHALYQKIKEISYDAHSYQSQIVAQSDQPQKC